MVTLFDRESHDLFDQHTKWHLKSTTLQALKTQHLINEFQRYLINNIQQINSTIYQKFLVKIPLMKFRSLRTLQNHSARRFSLVV